MREPPLSALCRWVAFLLVGGEGGDAGNTCLSGPAEELSRVKGWLFCLFLQRRINMRTISVNLDGLTVEIQQVQVPLKKLILDVENPRIQYYLDTRLNDNITQEKIKFALAEGNDQYEKLRGTFGMVIYKELDPNSSDLTSVKNL
jgi:hypothetical protein